MNNTTVYPQHFYPHPDTVLVRLANKDAAARIHQQDLNVLVAGGWSVRWLYNASGPGPAYVRCTNSKVKGNLQTVARLILNASKGQVVRYLDGDHLNLCRDNLYLAKGNARGQTSSSTKNLSGVI